MPLYQFSWVVLKSSKKDKAHFLHLLQFRLHGFEGVDGERGGGDGYATLGGQPRLQVVHQSFAGIVYLFRLFHVLLLNIQHLTFNTLRSKLLHPFHQVVVVGYLMIVDSRTRELLEEPVGTGYLAIFYASQVEG